MTGIALRRLTKLWSEDERTTVSCALRTAAEKYKTNAEELRKYVKGTERLAEQFDRQVESALKMAEEIDEADSIGFWKDDER